MSRLDFVMSSSTHDPDHVFDVSQVEISINAERSNIFYFYQQTLLLKQLWNSENKESGVSDHMPPASPHSCCLHELDRHDRHLREWVAFVFKTENKNKTVAVHSAPWRRAPARAAFWAAATQSLLWHRILERTLFRTRLKRGDRSCWVINLCDLIINKLNQWWVFGVATLNMCRLNSLILTCDSQNGHLISC